jgi:hypothetical protein
MFVAYTFVIFLNVFVPHLPAATLLKSYAPGVVTAPGPFCVRRAVADYCVWEIGVRVAR